MSDGPYYAGPSMDFGFRVWRGRTLASEPLTDCQAESLAIKLNEAWRAGYVRGEEDGRKREELRHER